MRLPGSTELKLRHYHAVYAANVQLPPLGSEVRFVSRWQFNSEPSFDRMRAVSVPCASRHVVLKLMVSPRWMVDVAWFLPHQTCISRLT